MKTYEERLAELTNVVVELVWSYTIFSEYWQKSDKYRDARFAHPEFSLVMHNALLCNFFNLTRILFKAGGNDESLPNLIAHSERTHHKAALSEQLNLKRKALEETLEKLRDVRDAVFAHRFQDSKVEDEMKTTKPRLDQMKAVANLAKEIIYELHDEKQRKFLDGQQLSQSTLQQVESATRKVLDAFVSGE